MMNFVDGSESIKIRYLNRRSASNRHHDDDDDSETETGVLIELEVNDDKFVQKDSQEKAHDKSTKGTRLFMAAYRIVANVKQGWEIPRITLEETFF